mgnify:CR=1 FL=1
MATALDIPIRLHTPAEYRAMSYNELLAQLNDLNAIERFLPVETYRLHKALVGSHMANLQRAAAIAAYQAQIEAAERHITDIEARLAQ